MIENKDLAAMRALMKNAGGGTGGGGAQPDWNANEGEAGHILNRTHWKSHDAAEIIPTASITPVYDSYYQINLAQTNHFELVEGDGYTVIFDGTIYNCYAKTGSVPLPYIGIGNAAFVGGEDTGEPFLVVNIPNVASGVICADTNTHTINVLGMKWNYHQIPEEYIPCPDYIVRFRYDATSDSYTVDQEWDEIVAAVKSTKNIIGVLHGIFTRSTGDSGTEIKRFIFASAEIFDEGSTAESVITFFSLGTFTLAHIVRNGETGEVTVTMNL